MSKKKKSSKPIFDDGSEQLELPLEYTSDGKHPIVPDPLWEDFKRVQFIKRWNALCPDGRLMRATPFGQKKGKQAGKPSYVIERESGIVT